MAGIDNALGISQQVLAIRTQRMNLLAANIANADTPNYKARDIDFQSALASAQSERSSNGTRMSATNPDHFALTDAMGTAAHVQYRSADSLSLNGNTVEPHREHAQFMENAMKYQVSLNLLDSRIKGLMGAIKGGQ